MEYELIEEEEANYIVGGEAFTAATMVALVSVLAMIVIIYKIFSSTKGKTKLGDNSFEWS